MRTTKTRAAAAAMALALCAAGMSGCASKPKDLLTQTVISWKNSEWDRNPDHRPDWVKAYLSGGISKVQKLSAYKEYQCFVGTARSVNLTFAERWVQSFNVQQQMGEFFMTCTVNMLAAQEAGSAEESSQGTAGKNVAVSAERTAEMDRAIRDRLGTVNVASFSGAIREGDFWQYTRTYDPDDQEVYSDEYTAYVMYKLPKPKAAEILKAYTQAVIDQIPDLAQIATGAQAELTAGNLDFVDSAFEEADKKARPQEAEEGEEE